MKAICHATAAYIILYLTSEFSIAVAYGLCDTNPGGRILGVIFSILSVLAAVFLYVRYVSKVSFSDIYLGGPPPKRKWCIAAVCMPVGICVFYVFFTKGTFAVQSLTPREVANVLSISFLSMALRAGITEEVIFRGMMLGSLQRAWGKKRAVLIVNFFFILFHAGATDTSDYKKTVLLIVSVGIVSTALAMVTLVSGSVWSSAVIHGLYNLLSGESYIFHIDIEQNFPAIWTYTVNSKNMLLTGINGTIGFTAALPAVAGFGILMIMVLYEKKNEKKKK